MKLLRRVPEPPILEARFSTRNNTISRGLVKEIEGLLGDHKQDSESRVLVLTGRGERFFSPGFDLREAARFDREAMGGMIDAFESLCIALLRHPKPVVARLNGDALAGGCILASCCDFRLARRGARIGMTPMTLSIAVPFTAQQVIRHLLGHSRARRPLLLGENFAGEQAMGIGWLDEIASSQDLSAAVRAQAELLSRIEPRAYRTAKRMLQEPLLDLIDPPSPARREAFLDCWFAENAQRRLQETLRRLDEARRKEG